MQQIKARVTKKLSKVLYDVKISFLLVNQWNLFIVKNGYINFSWLPNPVRVNPRLPKIFLLTRLPPQGITINYQDFPHKTSDWNDFGA